MFLLISDSKDFVALKNFDFMTDRLITVIRTQARQLEKFQTSGYNYESNDTYSNQIKSQNSELERDQIIQKFRERLLMNEKENADLVSEIERLKAEIEKLRKLNLQYTQEFGELSDKHTNLSITQLLMEIFSMTKKIKNLEKEIEDMKEKQQNDLISQTNTDHLNQIRSLIIENELLNSKLSELEGQLKGGNRENGKIRELNEELSRKNAEIQQYEDYTKNILSDNEDLNQLRNELESYRRRIKMLENRNEELENEIESCRVDPKFKSNAIRTETVYNDESLRQDYEELQRNYRKLMQKLKKNKKEYFKYFDEQKEENYKIIKDYCKQLEDARRELNRYRSSSENYKTKNEILQEEYDFLEYKYNAVVESKEKRRSTTNTVIMSNDDIYSEKLKNLYEKQRAEIKEQNDKINDLEEENYMLDENRKEYYNKILDLQRKLKSYDDTIEMETPRFTERPKMIKTMKNEISDVKGGDEDKKLKFELELANSLIDQQKIKINELKNRMANGEKEMKLYLFPVLTYKGITRQEVSSSDSEDDEIITINNRNYKKLKNSDREVGDDVVIVVNNKKYKKIDKDNDEDEIIKGQKSSNKSNESDSEGETVIIEDERYSKIKNGDDEQNHKDNGNRKTEMEEIITIGSKRYRKMRDNESEEENDEVIKVNNQQYKLLDRDEKIKTIGNKKYIEIDDSTSLEEDDEIRIIGNRKYKIIDNNIITIGDKKYERIEDDESVDEDDEILTIGNKRYRLMDNFNEDIIAIGNRKYKKMEDNEIEDEGDEIITIDENRYRLINDDEILTIGNKKYRKMKNGEKKNDKDEIIMIDNQCYKRIDRDEEMITIGDNKYRKMEDNESEYDDDEIITINNQRYKLIDEDDEIITIGNKTYQRMEENESEDDDDEIVFVNNQKYRRIEYDDDETLRIGNKKYRMMDEDESEDEEDEIIIFNNKKYVRIEDYDDIITIGNKKYQRMSSDESEDENNEMITINDQRYKLIKDDTIVTIGNEKYQKMNGSENEVEDSEMIIIGNEKYKLMNDKIKTVGDEKYIKMESSESESENDKILTINGDKYKKIKDKDDKNLSGQNLNENYREKDYIPRLTEMGDGRYSFYSYPALNFFKPKEESSDVIRYSERTDGTNQYNNRIPSDVEYDEVTLKYLLEENASTNIYHYNHKPKIEPSIYKSLLAKDKTNSCSMMTYPPIAILYKPEISVTNPKTKEKVVFQIDKTTNTFKPRDSTQCTFTDEDCRALNVNSFSDDYIHKVDDSEFDDILKLQAKKFKELCNDGFSKDLKLDERKKNKGTSQESNRSALMGPIKQYVKYIDDDMNEIRSQINSIHNSELEINQFTSELSAELLDFVQYWVQPDTVQRRLLELQNEENQLLKKSDLFLSHFQEFNNINNQFLSLA